jgi:uncharacterized protein (DUF433 family)
MTNGKVYVRLDQQGAYRVGQTRVSLDSVVYAYLQGYTPESIAEQYPAVALEEIYGAIAFYLANREDVDHYLERQERLWDKARSEAAAKPSPVIERLRALKAGVSQEKS